MFSYPVYRRIPDVFDRLNASPSLALGILIGIVMPVVSGLVFPTYYHILATPWLEWTKLLEAPFLLCELLVVCFAVHRGMEISRFTKPLSRDLKIASLLFLTGLWYSSLFVSAVPVTSLAQSVGTIIHILFAFSIFHLFEQEHRRDFDGFWLSLGAGSIVLALFTAWRFLYPVPASQVPGGAIEWGFSLPGFISVRYFGTWTGAIAAFFIAMVIQRGPNIRPSWPDFFLFVSMSMTIWSGTRAAVLGMMVAVAAMILSRKRIPEFALIGRLCILTGLAATMAWLLLPDNQPDFRLFNSSETGSIGSFTSGRTELWDATYRKWLEAPLFGWGSGSLFWEVFLGWRHTQPHNAVLQFLMSWGVVGAIGASWLLVRAIVAAHQRTSQNHNLWPFMAMLYSLLAMSMVDGALYYPRFVMVIMLCLAVILSERTSEPKLENKASVVSQ